MSNIMDLKFTESEFADQDISSLPNKVTGQAAWLKAKFDNIGKNKIALGKFNELIDLIAQQIVPSGIVKLFAGNTAPDGWLFCKGQAISRTTYADLFEAIGIAYGSGDGSTTFNVPNLSGKMPVGVSDSDTDFDLGDTGGAKTKALTLDDNGYAQIFMMGAGGESVMVTSRRKDNVASYDAQNKIVTTATTETAVTSATPLAGTTAQNNIMNPYLAINYIIRF